jgi:antitoxin component YwqK of YwqJK toxin-antitoxin module
MNKAINNKLIIVICCIICSCNNIATRTTITFFDKTYPPLNYRIKGAIINGKRQGLWITTDTTGQIETEESYVDGKKFGLIKEYSTGVLVSQSLDTIANGDTISHLVQFNAHKKIIVNGQYINGQKRGIWTYYFTNGKDLKSKVLYSTHGVKILFKSPQFTDGEE